MVIVVMVIVMIVRRMPPAVVGVIPVVLVAAVGVAAASVPVLVLAAVTVPLEAARCEDRESYDQSGDSHHAGELTTIAPGARGSSQYVTSAARQRFSRIAELASTDHARAGKRIANVVVPSWPSPLDTSTLPP